MRFPTAGRRWQDDEVAIQPRRLPDHSSLPYGQRIELESRTKRITPMSDTVTYNPKIVNLTPGTGMGMD